MISGDSALRLDDGAGMLWGSGFIGWGTEAAVLGPGKATVSADILDWDSILSHFSY